MIIRPVEALERGDRIAFRENGRAYELARTPQVHANEHGLMELAFRGSGPGDVSIPRGADVIVHRMVRPVAVPCIAHDVTDGDDGRVTVLVDLAVEIAPFAVVCGECGQDESIPGVFIPRQNGPQDGAQ